MMHTEILDAARVLLLSRLIALPELSPFTLGGGTALSLQMGLRVSHDFDFFSERGFSPDHLLSVLRRAFPRLHVLQLVAGTCDVTIDGVQVSFFHYPYPMAAPPVGGGEEFPQLRMLSVADIAAMKLSAIGSRGSRKDFYDLFQILHLCPDLTPQRLLDGVHRKYGDLRDVGYMLMGLVYFEDAEHEHLPKTFVPADWDDIKAYFRSVQADFYAVEDRRLTPDP